MGNRIGVIFHDNWNDFSPLFYSHNGADGIPFNVQNFLKNYDDKYKRCNNDGYLYNPEHMMLGFIQSIDKHVSMRIENLSDSQIDILKEHKEYAQADAFRKRIEEKGYKIEDAKGEYTIKKL